MFDKDTQTADSENRSEHSLVTAGQRKVNLLWEYTQAVIALTVVLANLIVAVHLSIWHDGTSAAMPPVLSNTLFLVVGFYFSRTNHSNVGGVGEKNESPYTGR
jgi:hypothetical protein